MKIEKIARKFAFKDINRGEVFCQNGRVYLKTAIFSKEEQIYNAIDLENGTFIRIGEYDEIIAYPNAKLTL